MSLIMAFSSSMDDLQIEKEIRTFTEAFVHEEKKLRLESEQRESPLPEIEGILLAPEEIHQRFRSFQNIRFGELPLSKEEDGARALHYTGLFRVEDDLTLKLSGRGRASMAPLAEKVSQWLQDGFSGRSGLPNRAAGKPPQRHPSQLSGEPSTVWCPIGTRCLQERG